MQEPWLPADATTIIRTMALNRNLGLFLKVHAKGQMSDRGIIMSDVLYILKNGFVYEDPRPATQNGFFRYAIESKSPNSESRSIRLIIIPEESACNFKLVTVMWVDEQSTKTGTIIEEEL